MIPVLFRQLRLGVIPATVPVQICVGIPRIIHAEIVDALRIRAVNPRFRGVINPVAIQIHPVFAPVPLAVGIDVLVPFTGAVVLVITIRIDDSIEESVAVGILTGHQFFFLVIPQRELIRILAARINACGRPVIAYADLVQRVLGYIVRESEIDRLRRALCVRPVRDVVLVLPPVIAGRTAGPFRINIKQREVARVRHVQLLRLIQTVSQLPERRIVVRLPFRYINAHSHVIVRIPIDPVRGVGVRQLRSTRREKAQLLRTEHSVNQRHWPG